MSDPFDPQFIQHLSRTTGLAIQACEKLVLEVLAEYEESLETFVQRRHQELKANSDLKNDQIFTQILAEIPQRRFKTTPLTVRQIRRLIYG